MCTSYFVFSRVLYRYFVETSHPPHYTVNNTKGEVFAEQNVAMRKNGELLRTIVLSQCGLLFFFTPDAADALTSSLGVLVNFTKRRHNAT